MPAINAFTVFDRADTPVEHTFVPVSLVAEKALFSERGSSALEDKTISVMSRTTTGGYRKVSVKMALPTVSVDTSSGVPVTTLIGKDHVTMDFTFGVDATEERMKTAVAFAYGILAQEQTLLNEVFTQRGNLY